MIPPTRPDLSAVNDTVEAATADVRRISNEIANSSLYSRTTTSSVAGTYSSPEPPEWEKLVVKLVYVGLSVGIVLLNKRIFTDFYPFPVTCTWVQQSITCLLLIIISPLQKLVPNQVGLFLTSPATVLSALPSTVPFCCMATLASLALANTRVIAFQVARGLTLPLAIAVFSFLSRTRPSGKIILSCVMILVAFVLTAADPVALPVWGGVYGAPSSVSQVMYFVTVSATLAKVHNNLNVLLFCNAISSSVLLLPVIFMIPSEWDGFKLILSLGPTSQFFYQMWTVFIGSALLMLMLSWVTVVAVNIDSQDAFNRMGLIKSIVQVVAALQFGDKLTIFSGIGVSLKVVAAAAYSFFKYREGIDGLKHVDNGV